jgi:hypothetical protein
VASGDGDRDSDIDGDGDGDGDGEGEGEGDPEGMPSAGGVSCRTGALTPRAGWRSVALSRRTQAGPRCFPEARPICFCQSEVSPAQGQPMIILTSSLIVLSALTLAAPPVKEIPHAKANIVDLYLAAPISILPDFPLNERLKAIRVKDAKNGYLEIYQEEEEGEGYAATLALFRSKGGPMIAVQVSPSDTGCSTFDSGAPRFFLVEENWKDVTSEVFPQISPKLINEARSTAGFAVQESDTASCADWDAVLPRFGTTIKVVTFCGDNPGPACGKELLTLGFDRTRFTVAKTAKH